jgi:hypothetical protein
MTDISKKKSSWFIVNIIFAIAFFIPPLIILNEILNYSTIMPRHDYWHMLRLFLNQDGSFNFAGLFTPQNEHVQAIARIIYYINIKLFDGNGITLSIYSVLATFVQIFVIYKILKKYFDFQIRYILVVSSIFLFNINSIHLFMSGMSGAQWITSNLIMTLSCFYVLKALTSGKYYRYIILYLLLSLLGLITYSTILFLLPSVVMVTLFYERKINLKFLIAITIMAICSLVYFLLLYQVPSHHQPVDFFKIIHIITDLPAFLGAPFLPFKTPAFIIGVIGLLIYCFILYDLVFRNRGEKERAFLSFLLLLSTFGIASCLGFGVSRSNLYGDYYFTSRYIIYPAHAWLGFTAYIFFLLKSHSSKRSNMVEYVIKPNKESNKYKIIYL